MGNNIPRLEELAVNNHQDWLLAIQNSLKSGSIEELYTAYQNIEINPFTPAKLSDHRPLKAAKRDWYIGVKIPATSTESTNSLIHYYLENGAQAIDCSSIQSDISLEGVHSNMIYIEGISNINSQNNHLICLSSNADDLIEELTEVSKQLVNQLTKDKEIFKIKLSIKIEPHMAIAVAKLRSMRILWLNILKANDIQLSPAFIQADIYSDKTDPNNALIDLSSKAMYAALGNCDLIYLDAIGFDKDQRRIAMNIQHIMKIESQLHSTHDPLAGSYSIESLTEQITRKVWSKVIT